jgi:hypothetical protein
MLIQSECVVEDFLLMEQFAAVESRDGVQPLESLNMKQALLHRCLVFGGLTTRRVTTSDAWSYLEIEEIFDHVVKSTA